MIEEIILNEQTAKEIIRVQLPAYRIEAGIIGFDGIPQLQDTPARILGCGETFLGFRTSKEWAGFLSYEQNDSTLDICRLIVHPNYFRKGIARQLVMKAISAAGGKKVTVTTGLANIPALTLYESLGFKPYGETVIAPGVSLCHLERNSSAGC